MPIKNKKLVNEDIKETVRASISFPIEDYKKLEQLAAQKRVSLAWIVREAVRNHLQNEQSSSKKGTL